MNRLDVYRGGRPCAACRYAAYMELLYALVEKRVKAVKVCRRGSTSRR